MGVTTFDQSVMCVTAFFRLSFRELEHDILPQGEEVMSPSKLQFILAVVLVVAAFIMVNVTVAAKNENGWKALSAPGTIHRSGLTNLY